ncbi:protein kinase (incomplete catalytic triad) [Cyclospora cayetanensis]|uniref:Protein kinase (Incomplete catalytic triad) n=1 Tax=Cyclospora cayetanensis TaxID=88456 RepID=A0A1D3D8B9_9EIME|nr:protein kinase (incomplete catalytic triad) [Cyclospora cayetanensis]
MACGRSTETASVGAVPPISGARAVFLPPGTNNSKYFADFYADFPDSNPGILPHREMKGSAAHGGTWLVKNDVIAQTEELEKHKAKLEEALARLDIGIDQAAQELEEEQDEAFEDGDNYEDEMDYAERFNPHDREDPEVLLEERQQLKTDIEDQLDEVREKLEQLESSSLNFTWERRELPIALRRLDKPWEDFNHELLVQAHLEARALAAAEKERLEKAAKKAAKKGKKVAAPKVAPIERDVPTFFCAKVVDPGAAVAADGRVFQYSDAAFDHEGAKTLVKEVEVFMRFCWRYIVEKGKFNFEQVGLLPVVHTATVSHAHVSLKSFSEAAIITLLYTAVCGYWSILRPLMQNGSVGAVIKALAGKKNTYAYKADLLLANAKTLILWLYLPVLLSPMAFYASPSVDQDISGQTKKVNGCLGETSKHQLACSARCVCAVVGVWDLVCLVIIARFRGILPVFVAELAALLGRMLTMNAVDRPLFRDLVDAQDRWTLQASDWVRGAAGLLGFGQPLAEELYLDKSLTPAGMGAQTRPANPKKEKDESSCAVM